LARKLQLSLLALLLVSAAVITQAQTETGSAGFASNADLSDSLHSWLDMVSSTQARQPHWITPLATVTPRLEQEFRYDIHWLPKADGTVTENYGATKGLEFIPQRNVEIILNIPPYIVHNRPGLRDGFGDFQALVKYRLAAANEEGGNYILTAFLAVSAPTGQFANGALNPVITPTIAYGKGFGDFDLQGTFGVSLPTGNTRLIGRTYAWNDAFQYRIRGKIWPQIEVNYSRFQEGKYGGNTQVLLTPGVVPAGSSIRMEPSTDGIHSQATISDSGPGVPESERERIFERFQRGSTTGGRSGFGLGLAIGRELAARMNGSLELLQTPADQRGARFALRLPAARVGESA